MHETWDVQCCSEETYRPRFNTWSTLKWPVCIMFSLTLFSVMTPAHHSVGGMSFGGMFSDYFQSGRWKSLQLDCFNIRWHSGAGSPHSRRTGANPSWSLSAWSLHVLLMSAWVRFGFRDVHIGVWVWMWAWLSDCFCVSALRQADDLASACPASRWGEIY